VSKIPCRIDGSTEIDGLTRGYRPKRKAIAGKKCAMKTGQEQSKARC